MKLERSWRRAALVMPALALVLAVAACASAPAQSSSAGASGMSGTLTIALQPDLGYSPLYIVEQENWLKQAMPNITVNWDVLNSGSAIETGMIGGNIDVGAGGIAPFLIGADKGVGWKLLTSLDEQNLWLVCKPQIRTLKQIAPSDRISVVAPTSIQAIVLERAASQVLGNAHALDQNMVILSHPVSEQSFKVGRTACGLDAPPFEQQEVAAGGHVVTSSYQLFGTSTFNSTFVLSSYYQGHQKILQILVQQIQRAMKMLNNNPGQAASVISAYEKGKLSQSEALAEITTHGTYWTTVPRGYLAYSQFMHSIGLTSQPVTSMSSIELPTLTSTPGN